MKLAISNIGWEKECDEQVYGLMKKYGCSGVEIAPTRIFPEKPYERISEASQWADDLKNKHRFTVPSIQSIWFGRKEMLFGSQEEYKSLFDYTKKAIDFAGAVKSGNLVFGCLKNRNVPVGADERIAVAFFKNLGDYAASRGTVIGMEANPAIYNTNYINDTLSALELINEVGSDGFKLNLDVGTMIYNDEPADILKGNVSLINHVHISEPLLKPIEKRNLHRLLKDVLENEGYSGFVSVEVGKSEVGEIEEYLAYVKEIFG
jgi:sugar phosphate isomerase/epimerase